MTWPFALFHTNPFFSYQVGFNVLHAANYGAPQARRRVLFLAARQDVPFPEFPIPTHFFPHARVQRVKLPTSAYLEPVGRTKYDDHVDLSAPLHFVTIQKAIGDLVWFKSHCDYNFLTSAGFAASI
jgi:DNA (cytosine-5)-methyltransferase 1